MTNSFIEREYRLGDTDVDKARAEVKDQRTTESNYKERVKIMYAWLGAL